MNKRPAFLSSTIAVAGDNPVLGTWKLKSIVHEVTATGEKIHEFGEHPSGYISYSADGRMYAIAIMRAQIRMSRTARRTTSRLGRGEDGAGPVIRRCSKVGRPRPL